MRNMAMEPFELKITDSYYNMREVLEDHMELVENVRRIMESMDITPISVPIRGGTDGLTSLPIWASLCPNLCAGVVPTPTAVFEYVPIQSMDTIVELLKIVAALILTCLRERVERFRKQRCRPLTLKWEGFL